MIQKRRKFSVKLGMIGRLFPLLLGKTVYGYTAKALPGMDVHAFKKG